MMRVEKIIDMGEIGDQEIMIEIGHDDIVNAITESSNSTSAVLRVIGSFSCYMNAVPNDEINKMTAPQKELIRKYLTEQAARFDLSLNT